VKRAFVRVQTISAPNLLGKGGGSELYKTGITFNKCHVVCGIGKLGRKRTQDKLFFFG